MSRKNWLIVVLLLIGIGGMVALEGYIKPKAHEQAVQYEAEQNDPLTHDIRNSLKFASPYMGNAGNLINLNASLPMRDIERTFQLYPEELTAELRFKSRVGDLKEDMLKQTLVYNSTANFAMIDNLDTLIFKFEDRSFTIRRDEVEAWYGIGTGLASLREAVTWEKEVQARLHDNKYVSEYVDNLIEIKNL
ncbi:MULTISPECIES: DUF4825 domain-containing protein [Paenibacillus]|uniref:DUF4825 domain-containing protein n=1 Tax=Paenibacillus TaxID=44249 RepID=UPI000BBD8AC9|nr:DUF4825 domain-containing protein [Paenibacillus lautus]PCL90711.1 DUF4825 domain-containing protein [Paenibacillus lautus]